MLRVFASAWEDGSFAGALRGQEVVAPTIFWPWATRCSGQNFLHQHGS